MARKSSLAGLPDMKEGVSRGIQFFIRGGAATGAAYASNKFGDKGIPRKYHGPLLTALGLAGEIFINEPHIKAVAQGIGAYGVMQTTGEFITGYKTVGLSGIDEVNEDGEPIGETDFDWKKIADEAERIASQKSLSGTEDDPANTTAEPVNGVSNVTTLLN